MACRDCQSKQDLEWKTCADCEAQYNEYDGMFHSMLCPRCSKIRIQQRAVQTAFRRKAIGSFLTNEVVDE